MHRKLPLVLWGLMSIAVSGPSAAVVPLQLTGNTAANEVLQNDIIHNIANFSEAFNCPAISRINAARLNAAMVASDAPFRAPSLNAAYEQWDVTFCGKTHRFFIAFWPDPKGGSFLSVQYPYPAGAPSVGAH